MVYSITYRRPAHVNSSAASLNGEGKPESYSSGSSASTAGIPDALSFDNIINNGTCPVRLRVSQLPAIPSNDTNARLSPALSVIS